MAKTKKGRCKEYFNVNNYEDAYAGVQTLRTATTFSDNSVYAQVGVKVGTQKIANLARRMGIRTPVSKNLAMTLGGLREGVTPLDMAHAYQTLAQRGRFTYTTMSPGAVERSKLDPPVPGPAGIKEIDHRDDGKLKPVELPDGQKAVGRAESWPVLKTSVADQVSSILSTVVTQGTAVAAQIPGTFVAGKTGTTENYGDAWFVGWTDKITVAVWVGYPDELRPMETEFRGQPVAGGTYPANIWRTFVERVLQYEEYGTEGRRRRGSDAAAGHHGADAGRPGGRRADHARRAGHGRARRRRRHRRPRRTRPRSPSRSSRPRRRSRPIRRRRRPPRRAARRGRRQRRRDRAAGLAAQKPGGRGRETDRDPRAQKRHGSSGALVIPIRVPVTIAGSSQPGGRGAIRSGPRTRSVALSPSPIPSACVSFPGPEQSCSSASTPRRSRIRSIPSTGSSARISTAAPTPSRSHTALTSAWMP